MDRLKESLHPLRRKYHHDFFALSDLSFDVKKGESVGIIGKNGSGKSTLLKLISGVLTPTSGSVMVKGKVSALLELGAGFNPELTGIENVYFNGTLMGYSREEMDAKIDGILAFADIGEFVSQPVKSYSSGMFVRLAFAMAINVEPELFIVDEALSVGDIFFQQKCYSRLREIISGGTTCLFVTHDPTALTKICNRCILLDRGAIRYEGTPEEAVSRYHGSLGHKRQNRASDPGRTMQARQTTDHVHAALEISQHNILVGDKPRHGARGMEIVAARVNNSEGLDSLEVPILGKLQFSLLLKAHENICDPIAGIHLYDRFGNLVFACGSHQLGVSLLNIAEGQELIVNMELQFRVRPGEYTFSLGIAEKTGVGEQYLHDRWEMLGPIVVTASINEELPFFGIAQLPMAVKCI
jgi:ABC-type polysaccharide/polyol phosphate transport system ATPase subunit